MTTRRTFIKFGAVVGAGVLTPWGAIVREAAAATVHRHAKPALMANVLSPSSLQKFVDELPLPATLKPVGRRNGGDYYEVVMTQFQQKLHKDMKATKLWGYNGSFPGPTLEARVGRPVHVKWINDLPIQDYLIDGAYDPFLEGTDKGEPHAKTVVHVHGAHVPPAGDGYPEAWFTRGFDKKGPAWTTDVYDYPNKQEAATLWYHDHTMGQTRLNVYAGLAGFYLLRDDDEKDDDSGNDGRGDKPDNKKLSALPHGKFEVAIVIQDRIFDTDGSLLFPIRDPVQVPTSSEHPGPWVPEFFGDTILVNGKVWPFFDVEPRKYRFRILNGSNARFYNLTLDSGQTFTQIAAEQGFFNKPVKRQNILLAPGERADVIVDFAGVRGTVILRNDAKAPFPDGDAVDPNTTGQIMQFRTNKRLAFDDTSAVPAVLNVSAAPQTLQDEEIATFRRQAALTRNMAIIEWKDESGEPIIGLLDNRRWASPMTVKPKLGSVEIWNIVNTTGDTHPIHLHLVKFKLLSRQAFDVDRYLAEWIKHGEKAGKGPDPIAPAAFLLGAPAGPDSNETGFKDTVRANPGEVTTIIMRFDDYTGKYPWHCHIVDHEDNEMMQQFEVVGR
jgi:spore coat protein A